MCIVERTLNSEYPNVQSERLLLTGSLFLQYSICIAKPQYGTQDKWSAHSCMNSKNLRFWSFSKHSCNWILSNKKCCWSLQQTIRARFLAFGHTPYYKMILTAGLLPSTIWINPMKSSPEPSTDWYPNVYLVCPSYDFAWCQEGMQEPQSCDFHLGWIWQVCK